MNKNILVILVVVLVIIVGVVLVNNQNASKSNNPVDSGTNTEESMEKKSDSDEVTEHEDDAMMEKEETTVTLTEEGFEPANLTVKAGTKIVWLNESGDVATVNSDDHPTHLDNDLLNLGRFGDGEELSVVIDQPGTYGYHDHLNPQRLGTIVVE